MWRLYIDDDQANRTVVDLTRDEYTLGRASDNAVRLTERNISRHHAKLKKNGDAWTLTDLDSYNGSIVNGEKIASGHALAPNDVITLGDYRLRVTDSVQESVETPETNQTVSARRISQSPSEENRLVVLNGPQPGMQFPLRGAQLLVGRGDECEIRLDDTSVSRVHMTVHQLTDGVFQINDEASSNGLRVNRRDVTDAILTPGDVIELGDVELVFVPRGQPFHADSYRRRRLSLPLGIVKHLRKNPKLALSAGAGALVFAAVIVGFGSSSGHVAPQAKSPAAEALDVAERQLKDGQVEVAHETLKTIGLDSNLRQSRRFRDIETRWADDQFERAQRAQDATEERHILERIAEAPGVDTLRRKRAAELVALLSETNLQPSDLPPAPASLDGGGVELVADPGITTKQHRVIDLDIEAAEEKPRTRKQK